MKLSQISAKTPRRIVVVLILACCTGVAFPTRANATEQNSDNKRLLLLWQGPDGHKPTTHEFEAGIRLIGNWFQKNTTYQVMLSKADDKWENGPDLLERADAVVLFISQGSMWIQQTPERLQAFQTFAKRGGGLVGLHWAIGSKRDEDIADFLQLLGATHGGSDRKYSFLETRLRPTSEPHPVTRGVREIKIEDEFYHHLKTVKSSSPIVAVMEAKIDMEWQMVAWAWERPDGGRSFGFSGLHYHGNWANENYRKLVFQGILWTLKEEIPEQGLVVNIEKDWLVLPEQPAKPN